MKFRWPRGRYNGRRIIGFRVSFQIRLFYWNWKPIIGHYCGACHWLCFQSWWERVYE